MPYRVPYTNPLDFHAMKMAIAPVFWKGLLRMFSEVCHKLQKLEMWEAGFTVGK